jgi:hypothetical protein
VQNPADHASIVDPVRTAPPARQQRFDPLPFLIARSQGDRL